MRAPSLQVKDVAVHAPVTAVANDTATTPNRTSAESSPISVTITATTVPGPPTSVQATAGNRSVTVQWTAPTDTGGTPITGYTVRAYTGSTSGSAGGSAGLVANLVALSSSLGPKVQLFVRPGDQPTSPLLTLELDGPRAHEVVMAPDGTVLLENDLQ